MNNNEKLLTERLNETGFPFQEECFNIIKPNSHVLTKEYPYSLGGNDGSVDILSLKVRADGFDFWSVFSVECKKSKEGIKNWCFIKTNRGGHNTKPKFVILDLRKDDGVEKRIMQTRYVCPFDDVSLSADCTVLSEDKVVNFGFECNKLVNSLNRNQEEKIYRSVLQSVSGSTYVEKKFPYIKEFNFTSDRKTGAIFRHNPLKTYSRVIFLPTVVTTSDLYVASFKSDEVKDGEINDSEIIWNREDWVIYDFGLPDYLQQDDLTYRAVLIVNNKKLSEFYQALFPSVNINS